MGEATEVIASRLWEGEATLPRGRGLPPLQKRSLYLYFQIPVDSLLTHTQRYTRFRQTNCSLLLPSREKCPIFRHKLVDTRYL